MVDALVKGGANVNIEDDEWDTPLDIAVAAGTFFIFHDYFQSLRVSSIYFEYMNFHREFFKTTIN